MTSIPRLTPRESGKLISKNAQHIQICEEGVRKCAQEVIERIQCGKVQLLNHCKKDIIYPQMPNEDGVDWIFFLDALNFSFWNFSNDNNSQYFVTYKGVGYSGLLGFVAAVCRTLDSGVALTSPTFYRTISEEQLNLYLMGDNGIPCPLIKERVECLHEIGNILNQKYQNSFVNCIKQCEPYGVNKAQNLLKLIRDEFPCFRDEENMTLKDQRSIVTVSFLKRAQILIADLWSLFEGKGLGKFEDIKGLTMFADYRVPQSLQYFGVFQYSEELLNELNKPGQIMEHGSLFEIEIRGCSIEAVDRIVKQTKMIMNQEKSELTNYVTDMAIDYFLWTFRREKRKEMEKFPYHKVRSVYY